MKLFFNRCKLNPKPPQSQNTCFCEAASSLRLMSFSKLPFAESPLGVNTHYRCKPLSNDLKYQISMSKIHCSAYTNFASL